MKLIIKVFISLATMLCFSPSLFGLEWELRLQNDALAWAHSTEWDDFRTAGGSLLLTEGQMEFQTGYYVLTRRSPDGIEPTERIDEILLGAARRFTLLQSKQLEHHTEEGVFLRPGLTLRLFGNFGGLAMQKGFHSGIEAKRAIPENYSNPDWEMGINADISARYEIIPATGFFWTAEATAEVRSSRSMSVSIENGLKLPASDFDSRLDAGWKYRFGESPIASLEALRGQTDGPYLRLRYGTPPLLISRTAYLFTGWGEGRVEVSFPVVRSEEWRSGKTGNEQIREFRSLTEFGAHTDRGTLFQNTLIYPVAIPVSEKARFLLGTGAGWNIGFVDIIEGTDIERSNGFRLLLEASVNWRVGGCESWPYLFASPGVEWFRLVLNSGNRAEVLDEDLILSLKAGSGIRIGVRSGERGSAGIELSWWWNLRAGRNGTGEYKGPGSSAGTSLAFYVARL
ncbi:MAG TPA: hypothetical protein VJ967_01815 [Clostridia bacterium]|nr:hypothetical protein [Clostridia bacterium]